MGEGWTVAGVCSLRTSLAFSFFFFVSCFAASDVKVNQIQVIHSHNSFHLAPSEELLQTLTNPFIQSALTDELKDFADEFLYSHAPLEEQLGVHGVRSFEFDVFYDPEGGLYANRAGAKLAGEDGESGVRALKKPGWKTLHIPDLDFETTCFTLNSCLKQLDAWSKLNPGHLPIFIHIEPQTFDPETFLGSSIADTLNGVLAQDKGEPKSLTKSLPIDSSAFASLMDEILEVFKLKDLITPEELTGDSASLVESVLENDGWPKLSDVRDRFFISVSPPYTDDLLKLYPNLVGSPVFPSADNGKIDPKHTALVLVDALEPKLKGDQSTWKDQVSKQAATVKGLVEQGYLVRAFMDAATLEPRNNYTDRRDQIIKSGAHQLSTDFPGGKKPSLFPSNYVTEFADGDVAVCNPVTAPKSCDAIKHIKKSKTADKEGQRAKQQGQEVPSEELRESEENGAIGNGLHFASLAMVTVFVAFGMMLG